MIFVQIAGFLGADAEERYTATGKRVIVLRVAARTRQGKRDERQGKEDQRQAPGNRDDDTVWWRVNIWSDRFDKMLPYLRKGAAVVVSGEMSEVPKTYVTKEGTTQISLSMTAEIVKFSPFGKPGERVGEREQSPMQSKSSHEEYAAFSAVKNAGYEDAGAEDDLPF